MQQSEEFLFYPECHNIMDVAHYRLEHNIEFSALSEKRNTLIWKPTPMSWKKKDVMLSATTVCSSSDGGSSYGRFYDYNRKEEKRL